VADPKLFLFDDHFEKLSTNIDPEQVAIAPRAITAPMNVNGSGFHILIELELLIAFDSMYYHRLRIRLSSKECPWWKQSQLHNEGSNTARINIGLNSLMRK
jgi:hypothetical protein